MGQIGAAANQYNSTGAIMMHDQKGAPGQQDHGRHDPDPRGPRQLRGRRAGLQPAAGLRSRDPNKRHVFAYYSPRPGPGDNWPMRGDAGAPGRRLQPDQPLDADRRRQVGRAELRARDPARARRRRSAARRPASPPGGARTLRRTPARATWVAPAWTSTPTATCTWASVTTCRRTRPGTAATRRWTTAPAERWDARKTSANTADLRGKVLRIKPTLAPIALGLAARHGVDVHDPRGQPVRPRHAEDASRDLRDGLPAAVHAAHRPEEPGPDRRRRVLPRRGRADRAAALAGRHVRVEPRRQGREHGLAVLRRRPVAGEHDVALELREPTDRRASSTTARSTRSRRTSTTRRRARRPTRRRSRAST